MKHWMGLAMLLLAVMATVACSKKSVTEPGGSADVAGVAAKPGAMLAYEHTVAIELPREHLAGRVDALRSACGDERFGACTVLAVKVNENSRASVVVRIVPAGVQPLVALAAQDGTLGSRQTRADDLAQVVADTAQQRAMLSAQKQRLLEFRDRKDLTVTDMLALSGELAAVETRLVETDRSAADQSRRIETNLLTLELTTPWQREPRLDRVGNALAGFADGLTDGVTEAIELAGYGLPFLLLLFPLALLWRWLWRRLTRASR